MLASSNMVIATYQSQLRTATLFLLWVSMMATPSSGFASSQLLRPGIDSPTIGSLIARDIPATAVAVAPHLRNQGHRRSRYSVLLAKAGDTSMEASSRGSLMEAISTLRGGKLPVQTSGGEGSATAGVATAVLGAVSPMGGVSLFAQGLVLSMVMSLGGFRVREHFVVYGYGFSVALQAAAAAWLFRGSLHTLSALHAAGLVAYGLRLVIFCRWRDSLECFQERRRRQVQQSSGGRPYKFWLICSMLYALLALPTVYVQRRLPPPQGWVGLSQAGLAVMAAGLLVEGVADWQKSRFKIREKDNFISSGLFRFSRHANYFGEVVFWGGVWLAASPSFTKWYHWLLASLGTSQIFFIIARATRGLGKRQAEKYGSSKEWKAYVESTPALVPFTRQWGKRSRQ